MIGIGYGYQRAVHIAGVVEGGEGACCQMDRLHAETPVTCLIEGGALGADRLARRWAYTVGGITVETFPADWGAHGKAAGPIRNQRMIDEGKPDVVLAFPGGRGTADMIRRAEAAGIRVIRFTAPDIEE